MSVTRDEELGGNSGCVLRISQPKNHPVIWVLQFTSSFRKILNMQQNGKMFIKTFGVDGGLKVEGVSIGCSQKSKTSTYSIIVKNKVDERGRPDFPVSDKDPKF